MRYLVTSKRSDVRLVLGFDERGWLCAMEVEGITQLEQLDLVLRRVPLEEGKLNAQFPQRHFEHRVLNVTFAEFWAKYNYKEGKKGAERAWSRMSEVNRQLAYAYVDRYRVACQRDHKHLMYPASYLRAERWNDHA